MSSALCNLCGKTASSKCAACGSVSYCCKEHQKFDWKEHRLACKEFQSMRRQGQTWEGDVKSDEYSGTFRWSQKKDFMPLPPYTSPPSLEYGWQEYLHTRFDEDSEDKVVLDVALLDGLSFPMSFLFALRHILEINADIKDSMYAGPRKLYIVAVGCAERAEEHILHHTNYWAEIGTIMPSFQLQLWLVGPEMSAASHLSSRSLGPRMVANCYRGTLSGFLADEDVQAKREGKVVVIGYNTGMASGDANLKESWKADVQQLLQQQLLTIFTCANDHTDLKCEKELMASLQARYVLPPRKNLFGAVTTLHPPGQQATGWYSANAFIYAVQGKVKDKHPGRPAGSDEPAKTSTSGNDGASMPGRVQGPGCSLDASGATAAAHASNEPVSVSIAKEHQELPPPGNLGAIRPAAPAPSLGSTEVDDLYLPD